MHRLGRRLALLVGVSVGVCALPLDEVVETMRPLPIQPLPDTPCFVRGLALIRGVPVPVVDLGAMFDHSPEAPAGRFVTIRVGDRTVALLVRKVIGITEFSGDQMASMPPLLANGRTEAIEAIGALDAQLLVSLHMGRLVPETVWQALGRGGEEL